MVSLIGPIVTAVPTDAGPCEYLGACPLIGTIKATLPWAGASVRWAPGRSGRGTADNAWAHHITPFKAPESAAETRTRVDPYAGTRPLVTTG